ncbi:hypothetical protein [Lacinutrix venerupis]|nr:hypothetical protein [Lacinutrix venerupis]
MNRIEWWLLKYEKEFKNVDKIESAKHIFLDNDGTVLRLPPTLKPNQNNKFLDLFNALDKLSNFYKFEEYFGQQMKEYDKIKTSKLELRNWLTKNEKLGADKFVCFLLDYLDYDEEDKVEHLSIFVLSAPEMDILVNRADFKNTIKFLKTFNEIYWNDEKIAKKN